VDRPHPLPVLFEGTGITLLADESRVLAGFDVPLLLSGLSVHNGFDRRPETHRSLLPPPPEGGVHLAMAHAPDFAEAAARLGTVDLAVAGHTHGGQIVIPGFGPPLTFSSLPRRFAAGAHELNGLPLVVTKGVGMERLSAPRVRLFCPPDVTLIEWGAPGTP